MQILNAITENFVTGEKTFLSADEAVDETVLSVDNSQGFVKNDYIVVGEIGNEQAELRQIESIGSDNDAITISVALDFAHNEDETITKLRFNQRKFYRSTTKTGTFSHLSSEGSPVNIEVNNPTGTEFEDSTGTSTSWYKSTYYNSTTSIETSISDAIPGKASNADHYTTIYRIKDEAGFGDNPYISDETVGDYRLEAENEINSMISTVYSVPLSSTPRLITHITTLLAGGLLLSKEYGLEADVEVSKTGQRKIDRANSLLAKIQDGSLTLQDSDGNKISKNTGMQASSSNEYDSDIADRGELFNLESENFKFTDPDSPLSSSKRSASKNLGFK